jgi:hypothetical protein
MRRSAGLHRGSSRQPAEFDEFLQSYGPLHFHEKHGMLNWPQLSSKTSRMVTGDNRVCRDTPLAAGRKWSKKWIRRKKHVLSRPGSIRAMRKTPYTDAELDALADDFIAAMVDAPAWQALVAEVGERQAREVAKKRLAAQDANSLLNWQTEEPSH